MILSIGEQTRAINVYSTLHEGSTNNVFLDTSTIDLKPYQYGDSTRITGTPGTRDSVPSMTNIAIENGPFIVSFP